MENKKQVKWTVQGEQRQTQIRMDMGVEEGEDKTGRMRGRDRDIRVEVEQSKASRGE